MARLKLLSEGSSPLTDCNRVLLQRRIENRSSPIVLCLQSQVSSGPPIGSDLAADVPLVVGISTNPVVECCLSEVPIFGMLSQASSKIAHWLAPPGSKAWLGHCHCMSKVVYLIHS